MDLWILLLLAIAGQKMAVAESPRKELAKNIVATTHHTQKQTVVHSHQFKKLADRSKLKTLHLAEEQEIIMTYENYLKTGLNKINTVMNPHLYDRKTNHANRDATNHHRKNIKENKMSVRKIPSYEELISKDDYLEWWLGEMNPFSSYEEVCKDETSVSLPVVKMSQINKPSNISKLKTFHLTEDLDMIMTFKKYLEIGLNKSNKIMNPHLFDRTKSQAHDDKTNHPKNKIKENKLSVSEVPSYEELISKNDYLEWWFAEMSAFSSSDNICKQEITSCMGRLCVRIRNLIRKLNFFKKFNK